jgi:OOP family OmpA-OmpF porin
MFKQIAVAAALAIAASSSFAYDYSYGYGDPVRIATPTNLPTRYIGADVGSTSFDAQSDSRYNSYGLYAGVEFVPNFALEVGARRLGDFNACCRHLKIDQAAISLIGTLPLDSDLNIFGRVGYNKLKVTAKPGHGGTESVSGALVGFGVGYSFSQTVSARAEIQKPSSDWSNFSIGLTIKY